MEKHGSKGKQHSLYYSAALLAPLTHAASVSTWVAVIAMAAAAAVFGRFSRWGTGWVLTIQKVWAGVTAGLFLQWSGCYWESLPFGFAAPLVLLVLVLWTVSSQGKAARIGCVLLWPLVLLLVSVLLSGVSEIRIDYLEPDWKTWNLALLAVFLIPSPEGKGGRWKLSLFAVAVSVITAGVLSTHVSTTACSGIYELSRSLSLLGVAERFESLIAAAMTLGFYCGATYLLDRTEKDQPIWGPVGIAALIYLTQIPLPAWLFAVGSALVWVILPVLEKEKINAKK